jgi:hypothetical protein
MNSEYCERVMELKFKTEVSLLLTAITMFAVAMFFYSYQGSVSLAYPYRSIALAFVGFGSVSMVTASISYSKRSKDILQ